MAEAAAAKRIVSCPSCGAPLRFRGATSVVAVCPFCKSTLVRDGVNLENIGKQAELLEDDSPIQIGTEGKHRGVGFTVVGRIQYKYGSGVWSEWAVLFPGSKGAWLSDASREYTIAYLVPPQPLPPFEQMKAGQRLVIKGDQWYAGSYLITNVDAAEVVAGEGELPFRFKSGWKANVVDLRGDGARFATIDYSETPPHLYVGEKLPFDTFSFSNLRDPERIGFTQGAALAFKCAGCGAPIEKRISTTEVVACDSCGSVTDVKGTIGEIVQKNTRNEQKVKPWLPLGTAGRWAGVRYEVVGLMRRAITVDGIPYAWSEYLLHNVERGYAWITEYNGHFNYVKTAAEVPKETSIFMARGPAVRYLGHQFAHFARGKSAVTYLVGEFYWTVRIGEEAMCDDYVDPPLMLSSERSVAEITWSISEYVEGPELWKAFSLKGKPPKPVGVAPNQPSPHKGKVGRYWLAFAGFLVLAFFAQLLFATLQSSRRPPAVPFAAQAGETTRTVSAPFKLGGFGSSRATVKTDTNLRDQWLSVNLQLVDADSGRAFEMKRSVGFHNVGGSLDGSPDDVGEIRGVPPGRYTLTIDAVAPPASSGATGTVQVYRQSVDWSNFGMFALFVLLWPLGAWLRARAFETQRWSESDYAPTAAESDDDSGGGFGSGSDGDGE